MLTNTKENTEFYTKLNVKYACQKVLEILNAYQSRHILEVGCGAESLFEFYDDFENFTVVESNEVFCRIVGQLLKTKNNVQIFNGFLDSEKINKKLNSEEKDCIVVSNLMHEVPVCELVFECGSRPL